MFLDKLKENPKEALQQVKRKEDVDKYAAEYNGDRKVRPNQVGNRSDKRNAEGKDIPVNKIMVPIQRKIVGDAESFIFGKPVKITQSIDNDITEKQKEWFGKLLDMWKENRLDDTMAKLCTSVKSETEGAIVFYVKGEGESEVKIRTRLVTSKNGILKPVFNDFGDMVAFVWEFTVKENGKDVKKIYVWTKEMQYVFKETKEGLVSVTDETKANVFGKIPVVYMSQEFPEWWDVKDLIDRFENSLSKFCDVNDYFSSPKYAVSGTLTKSLADSDVIELETKYDEESGKSFASTISVLAWDRAPEAVKLELEQIYKLILELSSTPDLNGDNTGSGNIANYAMELMYLAPILKAGSSMPDYEKAISRCFSLLKSGLAITEKTNEAEILALKADISFTSVLPKNIKEIVETLAEATGGKATISQETATSLNPNVKNADAEFERIKEEQREASVSQLGATVTV